MPFPENPGAGGGMALRNHLFSHRDDRVRAAGSEHGTQVAGVLMGQPGGPILGIAPNATARIFSIDRDGDDGEPMPSSQANLALAIDHAVAEGAHPIDITRGPLTPTGQAERILAARATPPCPRYRGPGKRCYLARGVRVQRPRHAQRLAGSAPARPPILLCGLQGHQRHDQAPRLGKEEQ